MPSGWGWGALSGPLQEDSTEGALARGQKDQQARDPARALAHRGGVLFRSDTCPQAEQGRVTRFVLLSVNTFTVF